jgi:hypothetical protein
LTSTDGSDDNHIEGNFAGTNPAGTGALGNGGTGVNINGLNDGNVVGEDLAAQRNLISGNEGDRAFAGTDGTDTIRGEIDRHRQGRYGRPPQRRRGRQPGRSE